MPVLTHDIHDSTRIGTEYRYGCHNKPRPVEGQMVQSQFSGEEWPYVFSTDCLGGRKMDASCEGCCNLGPGDAYIKKVMEAGS